MADLCAEFESMTYLGVDIRDLGEGMVGWGSGSCSYRSNKWTFISVGGLKHIGTAPANIHYVETRLHTTDNRGGWRVKGRPHTFRRNASKFLRRNRLTGCCVESRAGAAWSQKGGWEHRQGRSSPLRRSTTSSSASPQTLGGLPFQPMNHYFPNSSSSLPAIVFKKAGSNCCFTKVKSIALKFLI